MFFRITVVVAFRSQLLLFRSKVARYELDLPLGGRQLLRRGGHLGRRRVCNHHHSPPLNKQVFRVAKTRRWHLVVEHLCVLGLGGRFYYFDRGSLVVLGVLGAAALLD